MLLRFISLPHSVVSQMSGITGIVNQTFNVLKSSADISEADLIYTETLMARGKEDYKDKEIVILGGGDGALLYELLKEKPRNVVMLEIDETVMHACSKYMRSICGDVLDNRSASNYQVSKAIKTHS